MRIRAVVVDDEDLARRRLLKLLLKYGEELEVVGEAANGEEAVAVISSLRPDVVFLDVQMPGCDGFEVVRRLKEKPFIVFATAYNEYALKAFEENSVDYLLKPVEQKRLDRTLDKLRRFAGSSSPGMEENIARMLSRLASPPLQRLKVSAGDKIYLIDLSEIVYFESKDKSTYLHTTDREFVMGETLAELEGKLDGSTFVRIHRAYIVNVKFIRELVRWFAGRYKVRLKDKNDTELIATRSYADRIRRL
jgi:two-component system, LytTR family, response regulator